MDGPPFFPVGTRRWRRLPRPLLVVAREEVGWGGVQVEGPPFSPRDRIQPSLPRPLPVAREEVGGVRELESGDRVGNILAENANNNAQLLNVAVDENIGNQANNNDHGDVSDVMEGVLDTAAVENIDYQANNNDTHGVVDAPVGDAPPDNIGAVENINNESINNDNHDVVDAPPVGNVTDWLLGNVDNHHMANVDPQEPVQVPPDIPGDGRQHLLPRRLPTRPALTRTQQGDDYVLLREIESERRAEQLAQQRAHDVVDAHVRNITDQLLNVDSHHDVADDPQELVHKSGAAREQLGVHESESEQQFAAREEEGVREEINAEQLARDPVGDVILDIDADENIGNVEINEEFQDDKRDVVDFPGNEEEHEYEWSSDIAQINHQLQSIIQQLQLKDDKITN